MRRATIECQPHRFQVKGYVVYQGNRLVKEGRLNDLAELPEIRTKESLPPCDMAAFATMMRGQ